MKRFKKICLFLLVLMILISERFVYANSEGGGESWSFLTIGVGAKAIGMGEAFVSVADDATATYWNPAGLAFLDDPEITAMTISYPSMKYGMSSGITNKHSYFSFCMPNRYGNFGASLNWFKSGIIERTEGTSIYDFKVLPANKDERSSELALTVSYGFGFPDPGKGSNSAILLGFNLRYMRQGLFELSTKGLGFDTGVIIKTEYGRPLWVFGNPRLGYVVKYNLDRGWEGNVKTNGSVYKVDNRYRDPSNIGWELGISGDPISNFTTAISLKNISKGSPLELSMGSEFRLFDDMLAIRTGLSSWKIQKRNSSNETWKEKKYNNKFSFGIGLNIPISIDIIKIDYVYTLDSLFENHQISISLKFLY